MHLKKVLLKAKNTAIKHCIGPLSSQSNFEVLPKPRRIVLISTSNSIFENLALEEFLYNTTDFSKTEYLLIWRNKPAIVFGKHQNPWLEANISYAREQGIDVARRTSGGGTVFHDEGNVNLSFLTSRSRYNRRSNLDLIVDALVKKWDVDLSVNQRDDIILERFYKISGTAARLGRTQSFHHCTLLMNVNHHLLMKSLQSPMLGADSKATKSFPSSVMNLKDKVPDMTFETLVDVLGKHYISSSLLVDNNENILHVDPMDNTKFSEVGKILSKLTSWEWVYGKTPKFSIFRKFVGSAFNEICTMNVAISVEKGYISTVSIEIVNGITNEKTANILNTTHSFFKDHGCGIQLSLDSILLMQHGYLEFISTSHPDSVESVDFAKWISQSLDLCLKFL